MVNANDGRKGQRNAQLTRATINQHPDYERAKSICPSCHGSNSRQHNAAAQEYAVLLKCMDCGEIFDLHRAAEVEIGCAKVTHTPGPWRSKPETDYVPAQIWAAADRWRKFTASPAQHVLPMLD